MSYTDDLHARLDLIERQIAEAEDTIPACDTQDEYDTVSHSLIDLETQRDDIINDLCNHAVLIDMATGDEAPAMNDDGLQQHVDRDGRLYAVTHLKPAADADVDGATCAFGFLTGIDNLDEAFANAETIDGSELTFDFNDCEAGELS